MLSLFNVTLCMFDTDHPNKGAKVFNHTLSQINFGASIFISNQLLIIPRESQFIFNTGGLNNYQLFMINELYKHLITDYVLIIHTDGFPINIDKWKPEFLHYDYIGAPWSNDRKHRVGNGVGIRSKRLCEATSKLNYHLQTAEDLFICEDNHDYLESQGLKFAPIELAADFSLESFQPDFPRTYNDTFMFHGRQNKGGYDTQQYIDKALEYEENISNISTRASY